MFRFFRKVRRVLREMRAESLNGCAGVDESARVENEAAYGHVDLSSVISMEDRYTGDLGFFRLVMDMRSAQRRYALVRDMESLDRKTRLESAVDQYVRRNVERMDSRTLFSLEDER